MQPGTVCETSAKQIRRTRHRTWTVNCDEAISDFKAILKRKGINRIKLIMIEILIISILKHMSVQTGWTGTQSFFFFFFLMIVRIESSRCSVIRVQCSLIVCIMIWHKAVGFAVNLLQLKTRCLKAIKHWIFANVDINRLKLKLTFFVYTICFKSHVVQCRANPQNPITYELLRVLFIYNHPLADKPSLRNTVIFN